MPSVVLDVIGLAAAIICLRGPVRSAAIVLLAALFLLPDVVALPVAPRSFTLLRLVVWSSSLGLVLRAATGAIPWSSLRPGRIHLVLLGFVLTAYVVGVSLAPWPADFHSGVNQWLLLVDQLLFLWCMVAFTRLTGARWMAAVVVFLATADAGIGIAERVTGGSYAHWWYLHARHLEASIGSVAGPLERRGVGGSVRVRANAEFALQYGWVLAMFLPLALAVCIERARRLFWVAPPLMAGAMVLSVSRSVFVGLAVAAAVWVVCSRFDRRVLTVVAVAGLGALALVVGIPALRHPYHAALADSIDSRVRRQQFVAAAVLTRPYTGLGLAGLFPLGLAGTDSSYVSTYGTLGVIGVVGFAAALLTPLATAVGAALRRPNHIAAAAAAGMVAGLIAAGAFDAFSGPTSAWPFWLLAAVGMVAVEAAAPARAPGRVSPARVFVPVGAVALGLLGAVSVAPRATTVSTFAALDARYLAPLPGSPGYAGSVLVNTVCVQGRQALLTLPVRVVCQPKAGAGLGYLVVSGPDQVVVAAALNRFDAAAGGVSAPYSRTPISRFHYRSTLLRTAPFWLGAAGVLLVVVVPPGRRRRARPRRLQPA